ncbi:SRPBCC domain-containing protein [Steroidobacter cummioxidans]|uniref:SRPBCC domain-containing protein n=1 Tax=Steroidobacter cummioxidans TaxID=1803913 RepID=UPI000E31B354|nr:SRPBCC domain-containing protein [Steroidobacter cummioxidans]
MQPLSDTDKQEKLPYPKWWPIVAGALVGLLLRLFYSGGPDGPYGAMMGSFIFIAPLAVSAVTVYLAERLARREWGYYMVVGAGANALFVIGTVPAMLEGWICVIVILPLFVMIGMVGAVVMGAVCKMTSWPKQAAYSIAVLPLLLGAIEPTDGLPVRMSTIERSLTIAAPREVVWDQLLNVRDIQHEEVEDGIAFRIGVPPPLSAVSDAIDGQPVRRIAMGKHVHFDQIQTERREHELIRWQQRFYPDSFPPGAFDQHVVMGGTYFDIDTISYALKPVGDATELTLSMHYRVSTRFNWYADAVARLVLGNLEEVLLGVYRRRLEAPGA